MEYVIVASTKDRAGLNIASALIERQGFHATGEQFDGSKVYGNGSLKLVFVEPDIVHADHLGARFSPQAYVFISRHSAASGIPSLTAHFPGNFSARADLGGRPRELALTAPRLLKQYVSTLYSKRDRVAGYQVTMEATHHGPTSLNEPVVFVEIGSSEKQWADRRAAEIVAEVLMESLSMPTSRGRIAIGLGGQHYSQKFTELLVESEFSLSSVASKYSLPHVDKMILDQMISKSADRVDSAAVDWKGLGADKTRIMRLLQDRDLEIVKL